MNPFTNDASGLTDIEQTNSVLLDKLTDAMTPGFAVEFDPEEAELAGAFSEDALSEADALDSCLDAADDDES